MVTGASNRSRSSVLGILGSLKADESDEADYGEAPAAPTALAARRAPPAGAASTRRARPLVPLRCGPDPASVTPATLRPAPTADPDQATGAALRAPGLDNAAERRFADSGGLAPLWPVAELFGAAALAGLIRRLRYEPLCWRLTARYATDR